MRRPSPQKKFPFHDAQNHPPRNVSRIKTRFISPKSVSVLSSRHSFPSSLFFFSRANIKLFTQRSAIPWLVLVTRYSAFLPPPLFFCCLCSNGIGVDRWGMILCNEGCRIFMPERASPPRRSWQTRHAGLSPPPLYLRLYSLCIAGG